MNDEFMTAYHKDPTPMFGDNLLKKLHRQQRVRTVRNVIATAMLPLLLAFTLSSPLQPLAGIMQLFSLHPGEISAPNESSSSKTRIIPSEYMTVEEARAEADFVLPTLLPEGYRPIIVRTFADDRSEMPNSIAAVARGDQFVNYTPIGAGIYMLQWRGSAPDDFLTLDIRPNQETSLEGFTRLRRNVQTVEIRDGVIGTTGHGTWTRIGLFQRSFATFGTTLHWTVDGWKYELVLNKLSDDSLQLLIDIANSME